MPRLPAGTLPPDLDAACERARVQSQAVTGLVTVVEVRRLGRRRVRGYLVSRDKRPAFTFRDGWALTPRVTYQNGQAGLPWFPADRTGVQGYTAPRRKVRVVAVHAEGRS